MMMTFQGHSKPLPLAVQLFCIVSLIGAGCVQPAIAQAQQSGTGSVSSSATNTTSGIGSTSTIGNYSNVGNGVNGSANGSLLNNSSTSVQTGPNTNTNSNTVYTPTQAMSNGGSSALVLPRNPLALPNANLGRSNFGLQFGVNNNPGFSNIFGNNNKSNALGWFMQGGFTIPFGKIPDILTNPRNAHLDDTRIQRMEDERQLFGSIQNPSTPAPQTNVQGKVVNLNAYNYATAPSPKLAAPMSNMPQLEVERNLNTPKVLALADAPVFSKPLGRGDKIGTIQTGEEFRYIAHTHSGWVKIILPNGREAWTKGQFEYLKNDYTEIDTITLHNPKHDMQATHNANRNDTRISLMQRKEIGAQYAKPIR
jgi:hypothetical protein